MKQHGKMTYHEKKALSRHKLDWKEWDIIKVVGNEFSIKNKETGEEKIIISKG